MVRKAALILFLACAAVAPAVAQGISGPITSAISNAVASGAAPTCASTNLGAAGTCALGAGSSNNAGKITFTTDSTGTGPSGTLTLTFSSALGTTAARCVFIPKNSTGTWTAPVQFIQLTDSATAPTFFWGNNDGTVNLPTSAVLGFTYICLGS